VTQGLLQRLVDGTYLPGQRLPTENQMQVEWGVSRSVVREAMKILTSQGLVRIEPGRGSFVNEITHSSLETQLDLTLGMTLESWEIALNDY